MIYHIPFAFLLTILLEVFTLPGNVDRVATSWSADLQSAPTESVPSKYNHLNQLLTHGSGPTRIAGVIDEPGTVKVNATEAKMRNQTEFEKWLNLPPGTHQIEIEATDFNENTASQSYEITIANEPVEEFQYDLNGNLTERTGPNGTTTYDWDAFDRLIAIHHPDGNSSHFTYDGLSRRVAITEKDDQNAIAQERKFLWDGLSIAEERSDPDGGTVEKRFYLNGVEILSGSEAGTYTYRTDHLGSIRDVVNSIGSLTARYDYDAWGVPELVSGSFDLDFKYTGHFYHTPSTLHLAPFRAYDAALGRWISRDPITEEGGINLYAYVEESPINLFDPFGLNPVGTESSWNYDQDNVTSFAGHGWSDFWDGIGKIGEFTNNLYNWDGPGTWGKPPDPNLICGTAPMIGPGGLSNLGKLGNVSKAVNSNLPHATTRAVERGIFNSKMSATNGLTSLTRRIGKKGFPRNSFLDSSKCDRVLVPIRRGGLAVYQMAKNGTAKLKTVINQRTQP